MISSVRRFYIAVVFALISVSAVRGAISIDTVHVRNAGNPADPSDGDSGVPGVQHFGAVPYDYRIGKYEVTNDQYVAFLQAKAASDPLGLYDSNMTSDPRGGISRSGVSGSFSYISKPDMGNKPVNYVSWYDAIRFANWLNNGQGAGDTETGAYTLGAGAVPANGNTITRNAGAKWFLTSEDEWYKAAYYNPHTGSYFGFPTSSNSTPIQAITSANGDVINPGTNTANFSSGATWNGQTGNLTTVGTCGAPSPYGTYDQGGNLDEWNEALVPFLVGFPLRGLRGGYWANGSGASFSAVDLLASSRSGGGQSTGSSAIGFRVASVPEPATVVMFVMGWLQLFRWAPLKTMGHRQRC